MDKENFNKLMDSIKKTLGAENSAIISNELAQVMTIYPASLDEIESLKKQVDDLKAEKENLVKVNGQLLQKVGFDKTSNQDIEVVDKAEDVVNVEDIIDEKGDIKE